MKLNKNGGNYWYGTMVKISEGSENNLKMDIYAELVFSFRII